MQLRSLGRRLVSPPPAPRGDLHRGRHRRVPGGGTDDVREDRISGLPEELLLDVLRRLGCPRETARTSMLSHRWRDLWTELRELRFVSTDPDALETALVRVRPKLTCLGIRVLLQGDRGFTGTRMISSLRRAADRLEPAELIASLHRGNSSPDLALFELPCFASATSIDLGNWRLKCTLPPAGEFAKLEHLTLSLVYCIVDLGVLFPRCPCLRKVTMDLCTDRRSLHADICTGNSRPSSDLLLCLAVASRNERACFCSSCFVECSENCDCDQDNWRNEHILLPDLEDVEIQGFSHEVDFLELVFRSAPMLKRTDVKLSDGVSPSDGGFQKLCSVFEANAYVTCNAYDRSGDMILFA
ncbi:hypothetical protein EJB05_53509, partial [Eragrostis curvula]